MSAMMGTLPTTSTVATNIAGGNASILALATAGLSSNKYVLGIMILLINLGARYIGNELNEFSHKVLNHKFARRFLIFLVIWMGSRDIIVSLVITICFILLSNTLLNENSDYCILPIDNPSPVSKEEYEIAKQMVQKYESSHSTMPPAPGFPSSSGSSASASAGASSSNSITHTESKTNIVASIPVGDNKVSS
jgi:hypothetical protein